MYITSSHRFQENFKCVRLKLVISVALKLVDTNLNYRVLGISTAAIFLSNDHFLYAPI